MLVTSLACEKPEEEIVPVPPPAETTAPVKQPELTEGVKSKTSLDFDSELYQYAKFKNLVYRILVPRNYDSTQLYPLHLFLHGIQERGSDNEQQLSVGGAQFQVDSIRNKYPSFIIFPQCPATYYWFDDPVTQDLTGLIDSLVTNLNIDEKKISIGGYSMGAYGTFAMVAQNSGLFKTAVAISGDGDEDKASLMAKTSWQIFAGKKDHVVSSSKSENMAKALKKAGATVSFILYPEADHNRTWLKAFSEPDFFSLLFSKNKGSSGGNGNQR